MRATHIRRGLALSYAAKCSECGFEREVVTHDKDHALHVFDAAKWNIKDPSGVREASGEPFGGDLCPSCASENRRAR